MCTGKTKVEYRMLKSIDVNSFLRDLNSLIVEPQPEASCDHFGPLTITFLKDL